MPTNYEPFDGDSIDADYNKFVNDIQSEAGYDFGEYREICITVENDNTIRIIGSNDEGDEWIWDKFFPIPKNWEIELVKNMFGGCVYLKPDVVPKNAAQQSLHRTLNAASS